MAAKRKIEEKDCFTNIAPQKKVTSEKGNIVFSENTSTNAGKESFSAVDCIQDQSKEQKFDSSYASTSVDDNDFKRDCRQGQSPLLPFGDDSRSGQTNKDKFNPNQGTILMDMDKEEPQEIPENPKKEDKINFHIPLVTSYEVKKDKKEFRQKRREALLNDQNSKKDLIKDTDREDRSISMYAPRGLNVQQFAEARSFEIMNLTYAIKAASEPKMKRIFQKLPRHMRRRAASHNIKRIPKKCQALAVNEYKDLKKEKTSSRKYRRKPRNLLQDYNRRSRIHSWLETHIWHAKRFHMTEQWGYKFAREPCQKSFRATYRASAKSCLLQDRSFIETLELFGPQSVLCLNLMRLCSKSDGLKLSSSEYVSGLKACEVIFYNTDKYPQDVIGPVRVIWRSQGANTDSKGTNADSEIRHLWIECHPTISKKVYEVLTLLFTSPSSNKEAPADVTKEDLIHNSISTASTSEVVSRQKTHYCEDIIDAENLAEEKEFKPFTGLYGVSIQHRRLHFVKFSLTGPLSNSMLFRSLQVCSSTDLADLGNTLRENFSQLQTKKEGDGCKQGGIHNQTNRVDIKARHEFLNNVADIEKTHSSWANMATMDSVLYIPSHCVIGLLVKDPRFCMPYKKANPLKEILLTPSKKTIDGLFQSNMSYSLIWDEGYCKKVCMEMLSVGEINTLKSKNLAPGQPIIGVKYPYVPILLIQKPGLSSAAMNGKQGYGQGWDVIIPKQWGMAFWNAIVYQGARVGGLREEDNISLESLRCNLPGGFPDSEASQLHEKLQFDKLNAMYKRYPKNKRQNYSKLGISTPFHCPWQDIVRQWETVAEKLTDGLLSNSKVMDDFYVLRDESLLQKIEKLKEQQLNISSTLVNQLTHQHSNSLICVAVESRGRSTPKDLAQLCIPTPDDLKKMDSDKGFFGPDEPLHQGPINDFPFVCKEYAIARHNVLDIGCNTRWVIGRVKSGRQFLSKGSGAGLGFISLMGLLYLYYTQQSRSEKICMFRNINVKHYRFCDFVFVNPN